MATIKFCQPTIFSLNSTFIAPKKKWSKIFMAATHEWPDNKVDRRDWLKESRDFFSVSTPSAQSFQFLTKWNCKNVHQSNENCEKRKQKK
jgi:hypothetical protein